ncbi:hypothetical protein SAMN05216388_10529 [Halorientalis persicus]|uniref:Uncharacterized protein n=1 Tax=Halorientalis persicus TaxID=1367881 RepID=A0A1H8W990_9EURY|nr:hypothetical protein [Halorientalis persicus]SEP24191.1 hypothetical protein SAMN05216388_10529 [Halorientalis persicus]
MVFQVTTACNGPKVDPDAIDQLEEYLNRCRFVGGVHDSLTVTVRDQEPGKPYLTIHGTGAEFKPVPAAAAENLSESDALQDHVDREQFLEDIAPYLQEQCIVQTVGHDKARFPLIARQDAVSADGEYYEDSLSWDNLSGSSSNGES